MNQQYLHIKIIGLFFAACLFARCGGKEKTAAVDAKKKVGVEIAKDVIVKYSIGSNRKAYLSAPLMYRVADTVVYTEFPNTVHVDFYNGDTIETKLDAHYAKYKENESKIFLKDSVTIINVKGDTLHTKTLYWDKNRTGAEFYTSDSIRIRTKTQIINGIGLDAQQDFKAWHIVKPTGFIQVANAEMPK
ncbi:MAG TPA: LPS export ABC transporter periplasmic protein LptC [Ferruginibacter sp.]|nr:LPS export ABC transporter periplasmic protein LptC [Ferruginibacter sp.]